MNDQFLLAQPKHRFAQGSGSTIQPINLPSGVRQCIPSVPGPAQPTLDHRFPSRSVGMPLADPGDISANTSPPRNFRPSTTSKTRMCPGPSGSCGFPCPRCTAALIRRKAQPVRLHQVAHGNHSFTAYRSAASREHRVGHLRPRMKGCRTLSESWLKISYFRRRREPRHLELASPLPRLPQVISRLHPQPGLRT